MLEDLLAKASNVGKMQNADAVTKDSSPNNDTANGISVPSSNQGTSKSSLGLTDNGFSSSQGWTLVTSPAPSSAETSNTSADSWLSLALAADIEHDGTDFSSPAVVTADFSSLSDFLQEDDIQNATFPDDFCLNVSELDLLRASFEIASQLRCADRVWDLGASSVFLEGDTAAWMFSLPANLQPTTKQLTVAHHPIIDLLPWPNVRNKLIEMYCMPVHFWPRHPDDGSPCSLVRLVYDMEDGGIRVWGADPAAADSWEVQDRFAMTWWWALDPGVLRGTNQRRIARGEAPLPAPINAVT
jgi:Domain of unknown function (DUF3425)